MPANAEGLRFDLYVRLTTTVSSAIQAAHDDPANPLNLVRAIP